MKPIFISVNEFSKRVYKLRFDDLRDLPLEPLTRLGVFDSTKLRGLIEFCRESKVYHIVSYYNECFYNRIVEDANIYQLACGDANPNLIGTLMDSDFDIPEDEMRVVRQEIEAVNDKLHLLSKKFFMPD